VVTGNRRESLRRCLSSLAVQTRPADRILVVDNASTDGTEDLLNEIDLNARFPQVSRLSLKENAGSAGGINSGMRWAHCNKFDWIWVMDDSLELLPDCLERMLSFEGAADLIQVRGLAPGQKPSASGAAPDACRWEPVRYCNFQAALIGRKIIESAGMPDHRYFRSGDDTAYGYIASLHGTSICLEYEGFIRHSGETPPDRVGFYLAIRNRFLTREYLTRNGAPPAPHTFAAETLLTLIRTLGEAIDSPDRFHNVRAAIDGLRDGIYHRFDRLPAV
jgi:rhamnopyranosyl-N-acetylglucosaminyl-diphospho-decaprenol beta-1,3/1,4-galactofuranosyltransferase